MAACTTVSIDLNGWVIFGIIADLFFYVIIYYWGKHKGRGEAIRRIKAGHG